MTNLELYDRAKRQAKRFGYNSGHGICARCRQYSHCLDPRRLPDHSDMIICPWEAVRAAKEDTNV